jgi:glycosyltransferase involved in cell wall biosynthesis
MEQPATTGDPVISVVIPHLNTPDSLARCLASVMAQALPAGPFEVIVVDNGSRPLPEAVVAGFAGVRLLVEPAPGPGLARNAGVAAARAPLLAFIDADCVACPGWLAAAHAAAALGEVAGGEVSIETANPAQLTGIEAYESVFGFRQRMYITQRQFSVTANMAMPRAAFAAVGPFGGIDIAEDLDWGRRAHRLGRSVVYRPAMQVLHPPRPDLPALERKFDRLMNHDWHAHVASRRPLWRWQARALALGVSPLIDGLRLLVSPRVSGLANRLRGISTLVTIRWYRCRRMLLLAANPPSDGALMWNR